MGPIGAQEMIFIFVLALLLFGPKKLPELGRMLGKGLTEFRRAKNELKSTFETHMQELEREARAAEQPKSTVTSPAITTDYSSASYPYPYDEYGKQDSSELAASKPPISEPPVNQTPPVSGTVARSKSSPEQETVGSSAEGNRPA